LTVLAGLAVISASAQESIRPSNTSSMAADARQQTGTEGAYNVKAGPVGVNVTGSVTVEATDNVGLSQTNREGDLIVRPEINFDSQWKVTELNTLRLNLGLAYSKYMEHGNLDTRAVLLDPGSQLSFDVFVGGVLRLNFHDRFAILQNPVDEPTLSNVARFDRFQNSAGVTGLVDLNDLKFVVGYDHFNFRSLDSEFDSLDRSEEQFFASGSLALSDALTVGVDTSLALVDYRLAFNNNGTTWTGGPFVEATLSSYTKLRLSGGYQGMHFDGNGTSGDLSNYGGWYGNLSLAQRLNQYWSHSLSVGREARLGLDVNFTEYSFVRYEATWRVNSRLNAGFEAFGEDANESGTALQDSEHSHRWGGAASLTWKLGNKISVAVRYQFVKKDSDLDLRSYYQNLGTLTINYDF
jgi:hypothetical protein